LTLELADRDGGVELRHTITARFHGVGRVLDPLLRRNFSAEFAAAMDEQARTEFPLLRDHLAGLPDRGVGDRERDLQQMARLSREGRRGGANTRPGCRLMETGRFLEFSLG
jgi:hypothetical protein